MRKRFLRVMERTRAREERCRDRVIARMSRISNAISKKSNDPNAFTRRRKRTDLIDEHDR